LYRNASNLVFVWKNNIYFWDAGVITQVTDDGSPDVWHGVPDWVYEEEVTEDRATLWYSPDGEYLSFLNFDDTDVPVYTVPYYMNKQQWAPAYPKELEIKYPKPGFTNPTVTGSLVKVSSPEEIIPIPFTDAYPPDDIVVGEVSWLTSTHERLVFRCFNRMQNEDKHLLYDVATGETEVIRQRAESKGWLENTKSIKYAGWAGPNKTIEYYADVSDVDGWNHIYLFPTTGQGKPIQLTSGKWEVRDLERVNRDTGDIFFTSSEEHPTVSKPYSVNMFSGNKTELIARGTAASFWTMDFSPDGNYYSLNYLGPNLPYQELYAVNQTDKPIRVIEDNAQVLRNLNAYQLPSVQYFDLPHPSGFNLSAKLVLPPTFDKDKKYPVLLNPYGGPNSQEVRRTFSLGGSSSFAVTSPELEYVTFTVDNRGTSQRGRAFRNEYHKAMGTVEPQDQIWAAEWLAARFSWVDRDRVGIWGWSYGGYLSAKVIEQDSSIISFAIITAPTTDCRLYDSIYAERYMGSPVTDAAAYDRAAIRNPTGFKKAPGGVLIQHGTGDDNVHVAHSMALVDMLIGFGVPPSQVQSQFFPDSDHNIRYHNANAFLYKQLNDMLMKQKNRIVTAKRYSWELEGPELQALDGVEYGAMGSTGQNVLAAPSRRTKSHFPGL
jgi:dipeptidyl-peptidase-4